MCSFIGPSLALSRPPGGGTVPGMIVVSGTIVIDPSKVDRGIELTRELMARTREEPGNISYEFFSALEDPARYHVFEEWESEEAIAAHNASEHFLAFMTATADLGVSHVELYRYEVADKLKVM